MPRGVPRPSLSASSRSHFARASRSRPRKLPLLRYPLDPTRSRPRKPPLLRSLLPSCSRFHLRDLAANVQIPSPQPFRIAPSHAPRSLPDRLHLPPLLPASPSLPPRCRDASLAANLAVTPAWFAYPRTTCRSLSSKILRFLLTSPLPSPFPERDLPRFPFPTPLLSLSPERLQPRLPPVFQPRTCPLSRAFPSQLWPFLHSIQLPSQVQHTLPPPPPPLPDARLLPRLLLFPRFSPRSATASVTSSPACSDGRTLLSRPAFISFVLGRCPPSPNPFSAPRVACAPFRPRSSGPLALPTSFPSIVFPSATRTLLDLSAMHRCSDPPRLRSLFDFHSPSPFPLAFSPLLTLSLEPYLRPFLLFGLGLVPTDPSPAYVDGQLIDHDSAAPSDPSHLPTFQPFHDVRHPFRLLCLRCASACVYPAICHPPAPTPLSLDTTCRDLVPDRSTLYVDSAPFRASAPISACCDTDDSTHP